MQQKRTDERQNDARFATCYIRKSECERSQTPRKARHTKKACGRCEVPVCEGSVHRSHPARARMRDCRMLPICPIQWQDTENPVHLFKRARTEGVTREVRMITVDSRIKKQENSRFIPEFFCHSGFGYMLYASKSSLENHPH